MHNPPKVLFEPCTNSTEKARSKPRRIYFNKKGGEVHMTLAEKPTNGDAYAEHHHGRIHAGMQNLLRHQLGLPATALQEHGDVDLHIMSALVSLGDNSTAEEIARDPNLVRNLSRLIHQALHDALEPKSVIQSTHCRMPPPKRDKLERWRMNYGDAIRYLGQPKR